MTRARGRSTAAATVAAAALAVAATTIAVHAAPVAAQARATPPSAVALQAKAIADAEHAGWVHEVGRARILGRTFSSDNDIGLFEGRQVIVSDKNHAEVVQIGQAAYIRGNASAIADYFGLTKNDPQQLADTWLSLGPADGEEYSTVIDSVTLKSDFGHVAIPAPLTEGHPVTIGHTRCIPIAGHMTEPGVGVVAVTLDVTESKRPLPFEVMAVSRKGTSTTTWTRWGKPVNLTAPPDAIPLSSLGG